MKRFLALTLITVFMAGLLGNVSRVYAQSASSLTAQVDRTELTTDDTLRLTLTLQTSSGSAPQLTLSAIDGFRIVGSSTSSQFSSINGALSSSMTYVYQLQPTGAGQFTIPALQLDWNGETLVTEAIEITVTQGNGAPAQPATQNNASSSNNTAPADGTVSRAGDSGFFIETRVDKKTPYQGEAVKFVTRLYSSMMLLGQPDYQPPRFVGFWHTGDPDVQQSQVTAGDGTTYDVTEITTWLFPTSAGTATIDPVKITAPGGFFSNDVSVQSDSLTIDVQPLPAGAPADFNGAVGQFKLTATPDRTSTRLGEPVKLSVELIGYGNWGTLGDPQWPSSKQWRVFNSKTDAQSKIVNGQMAGRRVYEQLFTPLIEGQLTLPTITYSYFDPATGQYQTLSTEALTIDVAPGNPNVVASLPKNDVPAETNDELAAPTLPLKPAPQMLLSEAQTLTAQPLFGLLFIVPVGWVAGELAVSARRRYLNANAARLRRSRALKHAQRRLKRVRRSKNVQVEMGRIVVAYLEDQMQTPLTGVPHSTLAQLLQQQHVSPALIDRVIAALLGGEASEYSPTRPQTKDDVVKNTNRLLEDLEQELMA
jgi:hypothetical protein